MSAGFRVCEVGTGTGGLTRDAFPVLDFDANCELLQYTATDISNVWAPRLLAKVKSSKIRFKARAHTAAQFLALASFSSKATGLERAQVTGGAMHTSSASHCGCWTASVHHDAVSRLLSMICITAMCVPTPSVGHGLRMTAAK